MVKASDFTSMGDEDEIEILIAGSRKAKVKKKFITNVLIEGNRELKEYGVYNSENDVNSNVKTKENEPSDTQAFIEKLKESVKSVASSLAELKKTVEEQSKLSYDSLDICIAELETYAKSLEEENDTISSANT